MSPWDCGILAGEEPERYSPRIQQVQSLKLENGIIPKLCVILFIFIFSFAGIFVPSHSR